MTVDYDRLQQVLSNLISNAAKFSREGEFVEVKGVRRGDYARVSVVDSGSGIPKKFQERIFTPFSQADTAESRKKGGTGLGLNISKRLIEGMGGSIGFRSEEGKTTCWIEFQLADTEPQRIDDQPSNEPRRLSGLHLKDDHDFAEILHTGLENDVHLVNETTLAGAKRRLQERAFDIVIIDIGLREGNDLELIDAVPNPDKTKIVVLIAVDEKIDNAYVDLTIVKSRERRGETIAGIIGLLKSARDA
ncbi:ATP-binding protein [Breoghania sp.]|uniref:ATP-binding protein n=1 Tax=Breoghania sp. TaxID=2065378 RepID=UPI00260ED3DA|nr:ATP-binding protein [Breoghania sp.]MDJ0931396.1 ATP-binding protein [Breoghania sp.]